MKKDSTHRIALLNPGAGLGDHMLCLPAIQTLQNVLPDIGIDLISGKKTSSITQLLDSDIQFIPLSGHNSIANLVAITNLLWKRHYQAVVYVGKSPVIQLLLAFLQIPYRAGYNISLLSPFTLHAALTPLLDTYIGQQHLSVVMLLLQRMGKTVSLPVASVPKLALKQDHKNDSTSDDVKIEELISLKQTPYIAIHPGFSVASERKRYLKAWPISHWTELLSQVTSRYPTATIFLLGGPDDQCTITALSKEYQDWPDDQRKRIHSLFGKTKNLQDLAYIIAHSNLLISVDSFPMHLGISLQIPTIAIFASTNEKNYLPQVPWARAVSRQDLTCRPCLWDRRKQSCLEPVCLEVPVHQVLRQIDEFIKEQNADVIRN